MSLVRGICRISSARAVFRIVDRKAAIRLASSWSGVCAVPGRRTVFPSNAWTKVNNHGPCTGVGLLNQLGCRAYTTEDDDKIYVSDDVNFDEVRKAVSDGSMVFLDVRRPAEITDTGRIGNAFNVPVEELMDSLSLKGDDFHAKYGFRRGELRNKPIVVYCRSGKRALDACAILDTFGFKSVKRYPGSWLEWEELYYGK